MDQLHQTISDLREECARHEKQHRDHRIELERLEKDLRIQINRTQNLSNEIDNQLVLNTKMSDRKQQIEGSLKHQRGISETLRAECGQLRKQLEACEQKVRGLEDDRTREHEERRSAETRVEILSRDLVNIQTEKELLERQDKMKQCEIEKLKGRLDRSHDEIDRLKKELVDLRVELESVRNERTKLTELEESSAKGKTKADLDHRKQTSIIDLLKSKLVESGNEVKIRNLQIEDLKKSI